MTAQKDLDTRDRILRTAARLLAEADGEPVSTRAVCTAAGVGAPTLYHHFGDKRGLFDAVAAYGFETYLASKRAQRSTGDPVDDLRRGWDLHVEYGRTNPAFYTLMYGTPRTPPIAAEAHRILLGLVGAAARAGRLRVPAGTAARMIHAAGVGVTLALIADEAGEPGKEADGAADNELSERTREAVLAAVTVPREGEGDARSTSAARAVALRAALAADPPKRLSAPEAALLGEWLDRIADG
ncbi:TetR/AcrR family transcriptional regulator [Actinomadura livida]|uniref:AcrR family transcriptional regulator n=1 Tax=Actinomadura livida TaxID=79909 RepID=A0A7W7MXX4_9ACTN|nr:MULTISPECIES: TetR/AcrR family transcriptional regulator [Actinomadura]MBB4774364.1 AcrR family transcriptional regulator [Actinomadura catellatispora]GGT83089.1 TetR family transcriptional regulator [Actinomadura livida]